MVVVRFALGLAYFTHLWAEYWWGLPSVRVSATTCGDFDFVLLKPSRPLKGFFFRVLFSPFITVRSLLFFGACHKPIVTRWTPTRY